MTLNIKLQILGGSSKQFEQKKKKEDDDLKDFSKIFKPVTQATTQQKVGAGNFPFILLILTYILIFQMSILNQFYVYFSNKGFVQRGM